jgi:hypothetical protein
MEKNNQEKREKAFSAEARAEAVARFAEAMNREDIDGFVFGVSTKDGGLCTGATGSKTTLTHIMANLFANSRLDPKIFMKGVALHMIAKIGEEADND